MHPRRAAAALGLATVLAGASGAHGQDRLRARYTIAMTGVTIGEGELQADIGAESYTASASGGASGIMSVLVNGTGSATARGSVKNGVLVPAIFTSKSTEDDEYVELRMTFEDGAAKEIVVQGPPPRDDRVPVTPEQRRGVLDPITALLVPPSNAGDLLPAETCNRTLAIFDGQRRYNLALTFKRVDKVKADKGYAGPVLVCGVVLEPIAGHRPGSMLIKYVAGRHDMEIWLAPTGGSRAAAPFRIVVPTLLGTMDIRAVAFETATADVKR